MGQATYAEDGWLEIDGAYFYVDYATRQWYSYHGIDLAGDKNFLRMASFRYHHPTSTYYFSPHRSSLFYSYPGYSNSFFYRTAGALSVGNANIYAGVYHPPYYSNQYMYSFFYNRWAQWYYWDSEGPNSWEKNPYQLSAIAGSLPSQDMRSTALTGMNTELDNRDRINAHVSRLDEDGISRVRTEILRNRINTPRVERVNTGNSRINHRDRWADEYRQRLENNRAARNIYSTYNRTSSTGSATVNRSAGSGSSRPAAVSRSNSRNNSSGETRSARSRSSTSSSRGNGS